MDKILFQGQVTDLYAEDYQYLQDNLEGESRTVFLQTVDYLTSSVVVSGFVPAADTDTTKIKVWHNNQKGSVATSTGILFYTSEEYHNNALADSTLGAANYVCAVYYTTTGTYNKQTKLIEEGVAKAIDYETYTYNYNRQLGKCRIAIYTALQYAALTPKTNVVLLGRVYGAGVGQPITVIDLSVVAYAKTRLVNGSIRLEHLDSSFMLPQRMVYPTSTGDVNDQYYLTPINVKDDLNRIRTQIKNIKNTPHWDDFLTGIQANDPDMNELHRSGIFPNAYDTFEYELTSSGTAIIIKAGKILINRDIKEFSTATSTGIAITPGDIFYIGNYVARTGAENHFVPPAQPFDFYLTYYPLLNIHIVNNALPGGPEYTEGFDYTTNYATGQIHIPVGSNIFNKTLNCYYTSGVYRCDMVAVNTAGYYYFEGTPDATTPQPPAITSSGLVPLYYLYRKPMQDYVEDADILSCRLYTEPVKEFRTILATERASYTSTGFNATHTYGVHKFSYTSSGIVLPEGDGWQLSSTGGYAYSEVDINIRVNTIIYAKDNDEIWINLFPQSLSGRSLILEYESIQGSDIFDQSVTIDIPIEKYTANIPILLFVTKGLLEGYHKVRFYSSTATTFRFVKLIVGKLEFYENKDSRYLPTIFSDRIETRGITAQWVSGFDYTIGSIVNESHNWYICLANHTSVGFLNDYDLGYWEKVGANREDFENLVSEKVQLQNRVSAEEQKNLDQELRIEYLEGKTATNSELFTELFMNKEHLDDNYENTGNYPVSIQDNNDWNNNWKERDTGTAFKNGFARPRRYFFLMEPREYYNLEDVGMALKHAISRYDSVNNCYWLLTTNALTSTQGQIVKLSKNLVENTVIALGKWDLPNTAASEYWTGIDVDTTGTFLYLTKKGNAGVTANALYKINIATSSTLGVLLGKGNRTSGDVLALDSLNITGSTVVTQSTITGIAATDIVKLKVGMGVYQVGSFTIETYITSIDSTSQVTVSTPASGSVGPIAFNFFDYTARRNTDNIADQLYADCTIWDASNTDIAVIKTDAAVGANRAFSIYFFKTALDANWPRGFLASTLTTIKMNPYIINGQQEYTRSMIKDHSTNTLWFKLNDQTTDMRWIYKIALASDIVSNTMLSVSGRFKVTRAFDEASNSGITLTPEGEFLEVFCSTANGKFLAKRAFKNALWAENQINKLVFSGSAAGAFRAGNPVANTPTACMVDSSQYYWTADTGVGAGTVDVYRYDTLTANYKTIRIANALHTAVYDMTTDGTNLWILVYTTTPAYNIWYGTLAAFIALMVDNVNTGATTVTLGVGWGTIVAGGGFVAANVKYSMCYDSDATLVYITNQTNAKIDSLTIPGVYTAGVYDLPAPTTQWQGIAYKNSKIFVRDFTNSASLYNRIWVMDKTYSTAATWYVFHIYQDPAETTLASGTACFDFDGNDIISVNVTYCNYFYKQKTLEDPTCLQLHTFLFASNSGGGLNAYSPLLSNNINCISPITERYFEPEEFAHKEDIPDKYYMAVGYNDEGFSLLHLDEYLSDVTAYYVPRYDSRKIRVQHYKYGTNNLINFNNNVITANRTFCIVIEKDIVIVGHYPQFGGNSYGVVKVIDLKSGRSTHLDNAAAGGGGIYYAGTLSQRNDGLTYIGVNNLELTLNCSGNQGVFKIHARTFFKEDNSDYNQPNPKTYVTIGEDPGAGTDLLVIDWDNNGNRTPVKVWNNIFNDVTTGYLANWIAPSGRVFGGVWAIGGLIRCLARGGAGAPLAYVWEVDKDTFSSNVQGTLANEGYVQSISPNSRCWKTAAGQWRHQLIVGIYEDSAGNGVGIIQICDIENLTKEYIWYADAINRGHQVDNYEDIITSNAFISTSATFIGFYLFKKQRFEDKIYPGVIRNGWSPFSLNENLTNTDRPIFTLPIYNSTLGGTLVQNVLNYKQNLFALGTVAGLQFIHVAWTDSSLYQTKTFDIEDPREMHYSEHWKVD